MSHVGQSALDHVAPFIPYLLVHDTIEDEDEESLEGVEDGEDVGDDDRGIGHREDPNRPGGSEKKEETKQSFHIQFQRRGL